MLHLRAHLCFSLPGYQRELTYRHGDGSFSAFGERDDSGSMWLTAFVVKSFAQARPYIFIDDADLQRSVDWFKSKQLENGCFPQVRRAKGVFSAGASRRGLLFCTGNTSSEALWLGRGKQCCQMGCFWPSGWNSDDHTACHGHLAPPPPVGEWVNSYPRWLTQGACAVGDTCVFSVPHSQIKRGYIVGIWVTCVVEHKRRTEDGLCFCRLGVCSTRA